MNCIDVSDTAVSINGQVLDFPMSYDEIKELLGEARIVRDGDGEAANITYYYDELGLEFEGSLAYLSNLKRKKAYKDNEHNIVGLTLYVTGDNVYDFKNGKSEKNYVGNLTVLGKQIDKEETWKSILGYEYQPLLNPGSKEERNIQVSTTIYTEDDGVFYDGERLLKDVIITFEPERPKCEVNYDIKMPNEKCLVFDTFNFKLAVINELMYNHLILIFMIIWHIRRQIGISKQIKM